MGNPAKTTERETLSSRVSRESGEGEIRTPDDPKAMLVFETSPFNRSGTSPERETWLRGGAAGSTAKC